RRLGNCRNGPGVRRADSGSGWRNQSGRAMLQCRDRDRHVEIPEADYRNRSSTRDRSRPARRRPAPTQQAVEAAHPDVRTRSVDAPVLHVWRDDREQLLWRPFCDRRTHGRQRRIAGCRHSRRRPLRGGKDERHRIAAPDRRQKPRGQIYSDLKTLRDKYADEIRLRFPNIPRRVSGYNLDELLPEKGFHVARALVGSECTCALVLEATVRLVYRPPARTLVVLGYPDVYSAGDHVTEILE